MGHTKIILWACAWPLILVANLAAAHDAPFERQLIVQADKQGCVALWHMDMIGKRADLIFALHDLNRDGVLSAAEKQAAALNMLGQAMRGVQITWNGQRVQQRQVKADMQSEGAHQMVLYGATQFDCQRAEGKPQILQVAVGSHMPPLVFMAKAQKPWRSIAKGEERELFANQSVAVVLK
jgi:hypothetical protein